MPAFVPAGLRLLRGLTLLSLSAGSATLAAAGLALLAYLLLCRALTPEQQLHTRPLYLDYSSTDLLAQAAFLPPEYGCGGSGAPAGPPADAAKGTR